ncbi:phage tail sheath family protein [Anaerocolumna sp. AGMB13025]|uniref:phage tail sheath family protein n=1 Tax=Anaerocolumna sp. AGMB13025 TaxID=3039116 RepID=UPI00241C998B|nr:phage tail sheath family protein [Anaerocolumna sp. AGMB13025]WFR55357.1 phage tail sheath family protein [Anaerocolumna sp. AGMB13025]
MSNYEHGIISSEVATQIAKPTPITSAIGVVIGTAPVNLLRNPYGAVNVPILLSNFNEAAEKIGFSYDFKNYTICQSIYARFLLFKKAPLVVINVLNPAIHKKDIEPVNFTVANGKISIDVQGVLLDKIKVQSTDGTTTYAAGEDYVASFTDDGTVSLAVIPDGAMGSTANLKIGYTMIDPTMITNNDIIGGYDTETRKRNGIECVNMVQPTLGLVPCQLLAPGWSHIPTVAAMLNAKAKLINGLYNAISITDLDTEAIASIDELLEYKVSNGYDDKFNIPCYPKVIKNGYEMFYSAIIDCVIASTDSLNGGPYTSPSNKLIYIDGTCLEGGEEIYFDITEANEINAAGIMTALNLNGWRSWGNEMGCYPANTDVKDRFIVCRRVFNYQDNTFKLNFFDRVDNPTDYKLIEAIVNSENLMLATLASEGKIAGGSLSFDKAENPAEQILDGYIIFRRKLSPFTPAKAIETVTEFDPTLNSAALGGE